MKHETLVLYNHRIYDVCSALVTADNKEDVSAAMAALYGLLGDVYAQGKNDGATATTATQTATA